MADKIYSIQGILPNSYTVPPVRGYTESERTEKLKQIEQQIKDREELMADRKEIREKYPNPNNLSFKELLAARLNNQPVDKTDSDEEDGFILEIGNHE